MGNNILLYCRNLAALEVADRLVRLGADFCLLWQWETRLARGRGNTRKLQRGGTLKLDNSSKTHRALMLLVEEFYN